MKKVIINSVATAIVEFIIGLILTNLFNLKMTDTLFWTIIIGLIIIFFQFTTIYLIWNKFDAAYLKYKKLKKVIEIIATRTGLIDEIKAAEKFINDNRDISN